MSEEKRVHPGEDFDKTYPIWLLVPISLLFIVIWGWFKLVYGLRIIRDPALKRLEGPAVYLGNHCSALDFFFMSIAFYPKRIHYVMSNVFLAKWWGKPVIKGLQQIPKSQFFAEAKSVMTMKRAIKRGCDIGIYPEGRMSLTGRTGYIAPSIGKLVKSFNAPVVIVKEEGFSLRKPLWSAKSRRGKLRLDCRLLLTAAEIGDLSAEEIYRRIVGALDYDDYAEQRAEGAPFGKSRRLSGEGRLAEGLELILRRCPACGRELSMASAGNRLFCEECDFAVTLDEYNRLTPEGGAWPGRALDSIPAWYDWQAAGLRRLLLEPGYHYSSPVRLTILSKDNFQPTDGGPARLCLDRDGVRLVREPAGFAGGEGDSRGGEGSGSDSPGAADGRGEAAPDGPEVLLSFSPGQLPTITGTLGRYVDLPGLEALYRPEFGDRRLPVFWMQAVEVLYELENAPAE